MGCQQSRSAPQGSRNNEASTTENPGYSWDRADKPDPKDLAFLDVIDGEAGKLPGSLNGNSFAMEDCKNAKLYVLDFTGAITIDDCINCDIILGPVKGSLFLRDCADCRLLVSCQQFRIRDSRNIHVFLHCSSQPVIENSTGIQFSNYQGTYDGFEEQFAKAGLRLFKNSWASIHDFTPLSDLENWSVSPEGAPKPTLPVPEPGTDLASVNLRFNEHYLPRTLGGIKHRPASQEGCVMGVANAADGTRVLKWINSVIDKVTLVQTSEMTLSREQIKQLFSAATPKTLTGNANTANLILLEFSGASCIDILKNSLQSSDLSLERYYISPTTEQGQDDIKAWDNLSGLSFTP